MTNLKLSIIVAAYNEGENIHNFFDFWLDQDYDNYEIIVVNDGSRDNTEDIVRQYQKKYKIIKLVNNDKNRGVGYTRYNGYINASGDVIKFSDADVAEDYPHQRDLISRLMAPFNKSEDIDTVYIEYYPYFDKNNLIRSLEKFYYYSPVLKIPQDYKICKIPSLHMPTLFRNKEIDLSEVKNIKNGEDRFIAVTFLKESRLGGKSSGNIILDVNNTSMSELYKRYKAYGRNSKGLLKSDKKMFLLHIAKPLIVLTTIVLLILGLIGNLLLTIPFILVYLGFLVLTIKYSINYIDKESKRLLFKICLLGPFFLLLRYVYVLIGILSLLFIK